MLEARTAGYPTWVVVMEVTVAVMMQVQGVAVSVQQQPSRLSGQIRVGHALLHPGQD
jgi:hypothetical protein